MTVSGVLVITREEKKEQRIFYENTLSFISKVSTNPMTFLYSEDGLFFLGPLDVLLLKKFQYPIFRWSPDLKFTRFSFHTEVSEHDSGLFLSFQSDESVRISRNFSNSRRSNSQNTTPLIAPNRSTWVRLVYSRILTSCKGPTTLGLFTEVFFLRRVTTVETFTTFPQCSVPYTY